MFALQGLIILEEGRSTGAPDGVFPLPVLARGSH